MPAPHKQFRAGPLLLLMGLRRGDKRPEQRMGFVGPKKADLVRLFPSHFSPPAPPFGGTAGDGKEPARAGPLLFLMGLCRGDKRPE